MQAVISMRSASPAATAPSEAASDIAAATETRTTIDWLAVTRGFAAGDRVCFESFYDAFFQLMYQDARRLTGRDENTCLDLVHEAMLKAIRSIKPIAEYPRLRNWCGALIKSVAYDWLRRECRRRHEPLSAEAEPRQHLQSTSDNEARWRWIQEQIRQAPRELQQLFALRYRWGWTLEQIAGRLGLKTGAVDGQLRRAIDQLRIKAEREFEAP